MTTRLRGSDRHQKGFTLVELLVVIAIIGILVALLLPAIQAAREAARRAQCQSQLHNLAIAVLNYESSNKVLPNGMTFDPALSSSVHTLSKYGPSWTIEVLPFMEEQPVYDSFDFTKPINDVANSKNFIARGTVIPALLCPSDPFNKAPYQGKTGSPHGANWARTNYAASAGRAFIYGSGTDPVSMNGASNDPGWKDNCARGVMGPNNAVKLKRITDGTSKTIMLGEIRAGMTEQDARGVWAMGHAGASLLARYGSGGDANGPNACYSNSDDVYSDSDDPAGVCAASGDPVNGPECMTASGGNVFDQATTRSKHMGGVFMAMVDGSVQFITDDIETSGCYQNCCTVWDWMILSADGGKGGLLQLVLKQPCK
jgi:prepilin-type N-terminal cleavage/methylation domain-containing protein